MRNARQVIIGNSAAGLSAIRAIREIDSVCPITLISAENCNAYSPVSLTYYLNGRIQRESLFIVGTEFYKMNNVETLLGSRALEVDHLRRTVRLENGREVKYDNLLIATGASPIGLPVSGDGLDNVLSLRTIKDAEKISQCLRTAKEVILIGAGLISLQVSDGLFKEGVKFTILEWARQVLPEIADIDSATIIQKEIESRGISVFLRRKIKEVRRRGKKAIVISDSGEELMADMVVVGIGVRPNIQLVNNIGIKVKRGILVDEMMQTNIKNIFAAGDVSEGENLVTGKNEVLLNWSNACKQGRIAGLNMAGREQRYEGGLAENITTIFGLTLATVGLVHAAKGNGVEELKFYNPKKKSYRKIFLAGERVVGAVLIGSTNDAGILKNFIRIKKDISPWKNTIARTPLDMRKLLLSLTSRENPTLMVLTGRQI
jgi:NAD(P)H-nitrite reductase large subunit